MGGFCLLVELHREGSAPAACAAGLFLKEDGHKEDRKKKYRLYREGLARQLCRCRAVQNSQVDRTVRSVRNNNKNVKR